MTGSVDTRTQIMNAFSDQLAASGYTGISLIEIAPSRAATGRVVGYSCAPAPTGAQWEHGHTAVVGGIPVRIRCSVETSTHRASTALRQPRTTAVGSTLAARSAQLAG
ncbi:hypothetical protein MCNF_22850 [Mycolicibacterium confluentis]|uniref:Uncharacterized protein n=1 Tax=Mycolicibacterium confluentis TaxID=28047 RepID=A0A7I7XWK6_9MYCO|nr:hypothetical protein MCNF_22850 [Mycolicibacterium confluentis]